MYIIILWDSIIGELSLKETGEDSVTLVRERKISNLIFKWETWVESFIIRPANSIFTIYEYHNIRKNFRISL